jgi:protein TonB
LAPVTGGIEMFDKLVESDTTGAEFKNRSRYFMVSSFVVGILFLTAVIYSLYAAEIGLGSGNFEIAEMLTPVEADTPEERSKPAIPERPTASERQTVRPVLMEDTATSTRVPTGLSAERNPVRTLSPDRFENVGVGRVESDGPGGIAIGPTCRANCTGSIIGSEPSETEPTEVKPPPPAIKAKPKTMVSEGVINGKATYLPVPQYSAAAKAVDAKGTVNVQVTIDEDGNVISAKAATGHPLLKPSAERAARQAKFSPTYLSKVAVKVTGVIVYHFKKD